MFYKHQIYGGIAQMLLVLYANLSLWYQSHHM